MSELSLNNVSKYFGATLVLKNINFEIFKGEKVGLVGRNGCGKSTILKLITKEESIDKGDIIIRKDATIGYLRQIPQYDKNHTVRDILNIAFNDIYALEKQIKSIEKSMKDAKDIELEKLLSKYSNLQEKYVILGGYDKDEKFSKVCGGLKITNTFLEKDFDTLSGGEKTTVMLGQILLECPDMLLLDEPTNHLDVESLEWLEGYLKSYSGSVIIVSHDRYFLDNVVNKIVEIENFESTVYKGNYSKYISEKNENKSIQLKHYKDQQKELKDMEDAYKRFRKWAQEGGGEKFYKKAENMRKRIERMDKIDKPNLKEKNMNLSFLDTERSGNEVIKAIDISKSFDDKLLFKDGNFLIRYEERVSLIGSNGCGKSTLLKILLNNETLDNGVLSLGANVKVGYLPQIVEFEDENLNVLDCFRGNLYLRDGEVREYLSKYMFFGESVYKKVKSLSGGEKTRLKLAKLLFNEVNLLILDEPTNHLDIESIENLEKSLQNFKGTIFFVSHDRYFINKISTKIISIENKTFNIYEGNYDNYKTIKANLVEEIQKNSIKKEKKTRPVRTNVKKKLENDTLKLEDKISVLESKIQELENYMLTLGSNYEEINKCFSEKEILQNELDEVLNKWVELSS